MQQVKFRVGATKSRRGKLVAVSSQTFLCRVPRTIVVAALAGSGKRKKCRAFVQMEGNYPRNLLQSQSLSEAKFLYKVQSVE